MVYFGCVPFSCYRGSQPTHPHWPRVVSYVSFLPVDRCFRVFFSSSLLALSKALGGCSFFAAFLYEFSRDAIPLVRIACFSSSCFTTSS